jgi:hypothetical protein
MAYGLKYRSEFVNAQGHSCRLDLFYKDYSGATIALNSGLRAFVLREFNSDNDFYKPIRPQQAEFEILADVVTLESFLFNDDDSVQVQFSWEGNLYWRGWLIQDDFEESWVDSAHFITLRATEQLSGLNIIAPNLPNGHNTPLDFILNAISTTSIGNQFNYGIRILNNLFYETMTDKDVDDTATCLDQMYIANSTFQKTITTFDDYQTILEKINTSFNQTIFQYQGAAYIMRMSEFLTYPNVLPAIQFRPLLIPTVISTVEDYKAYIGIDSEIKPIMPEMLRQVERPYKNFQIDFLNIFPPELITNESFKIGSLILQTNRIRNFSVDYWSLKTWITRTTNANGSFYRSQELNNGQILDEYLIIFGDFNYENYLVSQPLLIEESNFFSIEFEFKNTISQDLLTGNVNTVYVTLEAFTGEKYTLDNDGTWVLSNSTYTSNVKALTVRYENEIPFYNYKTVNVTSRLTPKKGYIYVNFINKNISTNFQPIIKTLKIGVSTAVPTDIVGDYDLLTKTEAIKNNLTITTNLDDGENLYWKGVIFSPDNTLTGDNWYRMQYQSESFTFKRQKAIAHWLLNRRYRQLITGNFYGISWSSNERPIGLMNRFIFSDDAPTKQFMIVNLQEIDFVSCQWKATLIETYDSTLDATLTDYPPHSFDFLYQE